MNDETVIIYRPGGGFQLMFGSRAYLDANVEFQLARFPDAQVRFTAGTDIEGICSGIDPNIPTTVEEFDAAYPAKAD
ncbi:hypothetical protein [Caulobacter sp. UC70_42]|uniref:hypothetical protein n=1 Tax=Caulobacter sp. UC70_42 TaxID=3374551 RepID=UPI003757424F